MSANDSFNESFYSYLEAHLERTFAHSNQERIQTLWCDGIRPPIIESQLTKKSVDDSRQIVTKAFIGHSPTADAYDLTILFGKYSLRRYAKGASLIDCIPDSESTDWMEIDTASHTIQIQLK
ncbi:hypothetical protein [Hymenobacter elongatus]|uniref:Uncharacterized protein n=1 Tax=Hymenobacter elongatus TaxID=877208 RepID=A0A4Z0PS80_9BACT|nr:hypothetical protein [Hymenobacter elongatus]TGE20164.1 hypothetical protein E5J99_00930 [Hymenobacter elongatus]